MRNNITSRALSGKPTRCWQLIALASFSSFPSFSQGIDNLEVVLDGYAYAVNSDVTISLNQQFIFIAQSDLENCLRENQSNPLTNSDWALITNNQGIGILQIQYDVGNQLLFLGSETNDVICDNGIFIDTIFEQGFEPPDLIFTQGFEI